MSALRWGAATHPGLVRTDNEDAYLAEPLVFAVADGMGGHQAGEVASALAVQTLHDRLGAGVSELEVVVGSVTEANAAIFRAAHSNAGQQGMGTTLTAIAVLAATDEHPRTLAIVNVGDSRTYRVRGGVLERITIDHSYVQELVSTGHISEMEARTHPRRNIVTRALGIEPTVRVDSWVLSMVKGDRFVLCSDGLVDEVPDHEIELVAAGLSDPQAAADELVAMANRHGGRDNVTVLVVDVLEGLEVPPETPAPPASASAAASLGDTTRLPVLPGADPHAADPHAADQRPDAVGGEDPASAVPPSAPPDEITQRLAVTAGAAAQQGAGATAGTPPTPAGAASPAGPAGPITLPAAQPAGAPARPGAASPGKRRRRLTAGTLVFLVGIAAVVTVVITVLALALSGDDGDDPTEDTVDTTEVDDTSEGTGATSPATASDDTGSDTLPPTTLPDSTDATTRTTRTTIATTTATTTLANTPPSRPGGRPGTTLGPGG